VQNLGTLCWWVITFMKQRLNPAWVRAGKTTSTSFPVPANFEDLATRANHTIELAAIALEEAYSEIDQLSTLLAQKKECPDSAG
jgi:hypothetical protein